MRQAILKEPANFEVREVEDCVRRPGEALVRVHRVGICGTDIHAYHGRQPFFNYPRVLGHELAVEILELPDASEGGHGNPAGLAVGDRCSVEPYMNCGQCLACNIGKPNCCENLQVLGVHTDGGMQPLLSVPPHKLHRGNELSYDQLALVETLGIGAHAVERADVQRGELVLVAGAGPIGLSVMPFAQARGARVVVMDINAQRLDFCRERLGIEMTLNPLRQPVEETLRELGGGALPAVVIDATGNAKSMQGCFDLTAHGGRIVFVGLFPGEVSFNDPNFHRRELTLMASRNALPSTFSTTIGLIAAGRIDTSSWITHRLELADLPVQFGPTSAAEGLVKAMIEL